MSTVVGTPPGVTASGYRVTPFGGPDTVPGLLGWWDATRPGDFTYSTGNDPSNPPNTYVSRWNDRSVAARHAVGSANPGYHPKRNVTINGLAAVDFSSGYVAVTKALGITGLTVNQTKPVSYFSALRMPATPAAYTMISVGTTNQGCVIRLGANGDQLEMVIAGVGAWATTARGVVQPSGVYVITCTYSAIGVYQIAVNGVSVSSGTLNLSVGASGGALGLASGFEEATNSFAGHLGEALMYSRDVTATERTNIESYLRTKWGTP